MFSQAIRGGDPIPSCDLLGKLNAVAFQPSQIEAALRVLATLPPQAQANPIAQAQALQHYAAEAGLGDGPSVSTAIHARITALARWTAAHDPKRQSDAEAIMSATASFPLSDLPDSIGFEPAAFQEMLLYIEDLPW